MNRRPPPRRPQSGRPQSGKPQSGRPGYYWHRYHWYPYHDWYWYDYDYDWGDYYDDDLDLYDYYYHFDRYDTSKNAFEQGFRAGLKQARKEMSAGEHTEVESRHAGYCGSMAAGE